MIVNKIEVNSGYSHTGTMLRTMACHELTNPSMT